MARPIPAERADLLNRDVPLFTTRPKARGLLTSQGEVIAEFFQESDLHQAQKRISLLDEQDLARQVWVINPSLACLVKDPSHGGNRILPLPPAPTKFRRAACWKQHLLWVMLWSERLSGEPGSLDG